MCGDAVSDPAQVNHANDELVSLRLHSVHARRSGFIFLPPQRRKNQWRVISDSACDSDCVHVGPLQLMSCALLFFFVRLDMSEHLTVARLGS